ncbi:TPA: Cyclin-dependent kinase-like 3 [Trebouxia sp. C0004]
MHRDLKPENMLLSQEGVLKLCDFGFARHLGGPGTLYSDYVATRWYRPPELLVGLTHYGLSVDVWALGCLLVEMATGQPLFAGETDIDQLWLIAKSTGYLTPQQLHQVRSAPGTARFRMPNRQMQDTLEFRFPRLTHAQLQVVKACIQADPAKRPTCAQLLNYPFFQEAAHNMPPSITAAQVISQQKVAAFMAHTQPAIPAKLHRGSAIIKITASARPAENGANATSSFSHARSQQMLLPSGVLLSPNAAPFYPSCKPQKDAASPQGLQSQASDVSMPDYKVPQGETGKVGKTSKQHIGFRMGSLQSTGSGLIGTGHAPSGGGITPRSSKRSLLPDLLGEGEQATTSPPEPSSPPKKSRLNKDVRCHDPRLPLWQSDSRLPDQAAMSHDMGHVPMSHAGQHALLGAESIVSRTPIEAAFYSPSESAVHQRHSEASALPQAYVRQFPSIPPAAEQYWQGPGEQLQQQPLQCASYQPSMVMPVYIQHAQQQGQPGWIADACTAQMHQCEAQAKANYRAEADAAAGGWPMPDHLVIPSLHVSQQQQQQVQQPTVKDFDSADFHAADAVSADDGHVHWQSLASASSRTSDTETDVDSSVGVDEQIMFEPARVPTPQECSKANDWVENDVPQVQLMSRDAKNDYGHKDLLHQHQLKISKKGPA